MKRILVLIILVGSLISCKGIGRKIKDTQELKEQISSELNINTIKVDVLVENGEKTINILIEDGKFKNYSSKQKRLMAKQIEKIILEQNKEHLNIKSGKLVFKTESDFGVLKTTDSESYKIF